MRETWYVLDDGSVVDPNECAPDGKGDLRHKGGVAVAKRGDAYSSRGVDVEAMRAKATRDMAAAAEKLASDDREMKPAAGKPYRTRGGKGE